MQKGITDMEQQSSKQKRPKSQEKEEQKTRAYTLESPEYETACALLLTHDYLKAMSYLEAAATKGYPPAFVWLCSIYEHGRKNIARNPEKAGYWLNRITHALGCEKALQWCKMGLKQKSKDIYLLNEQGNTLRDLNRYREALASYEAALAIDPKFTSALNGRGHALWDLNRSQEALASFEAALAIDPKFTSALNGRGNALCALNRYQEALASFEAALAIDPKFTPALHGRGHALRNLNRYQEALASYEAALAIDPKFTSALNGRGNTLRDLNRYQEALASYETALAIDPKFTSALNGRGHALWDLNRSQEALASYEAALAIDPKFTYALQGRGNALYCLNRYQEALASYEAALAIDPKFTYALQGRGNALYCLNRYQEALASYEAALAIDPKCTFAPEWRTLCLKKLGSDATFHKLKQLSDVNKSKSITRTPITVANFRDYPLTTDHASTLARCLIMYPTLTTLYADRSQLTDAGLAALAEALSQNTHLTKLTFTENPKLSQASAPFQAQIHAYLYRNRLLAALQVSAQELHDLDFSVLTGKDVSHLLLHHTTLDTWDFSNKQLNAKAVILQPVYLPHYPSLRTLNLNDNRLGNDGVQQIGILLKSDPSPLPSLAVLTLANNRIQDLGFNYLADAMMERVPLEILDLSQNTIQISGTTLKKLAEKFAHNSRLQRVILSGNALLESADPLLMNDKDDEESKNKLAQKYSNVSYSTGPIAFFRSHPLRMESVIDPSKRIDLSQWVVALGCSKGDQHAMLYLEGMRESGQRFLIRYHIVAPDVVLVGKAKVVIEDLEIGRLADSRDRHDFLSFPIDRIKGEVLQNHIHDQQESHISFSKFYNSSNGHMNCTGWCRAELIHIGLEVPKTDIPSMAARGGRCFMM
jgi:tetratricopeptide (TPR) repeat protein